jgi:hypothetical protein
MPTITLKGTTGTTKSRREGRDIVIEKTIDRAVITEIHKGDGKRVKGKQAPGKPITLSAAEMEGFENNIQERIREALREDKEETKKTVAGINEQANRFGATLEKKHQTEAKKMTTKLNVLTAKLVQTKQANKKLMKKPEVERVKAGMNAFANEMLKKVDKEHEEELKKALGREAALLKAGKRLRKERNDLRTEAKELKARTPAPVTPKAGAPATPKATPMAGAPATPKAGAPTTPKARGAPPTPKAGAGAGSSSSRQPPPYTEPPPFPTKFGSRYARRNTSSEGST